MYIKQRLKMISKTDVFQTTKEWVSDFGVNNKLILVYFQQIKKICKVNERGTA